MSKISNQVFLNNEYCEIRVNKTGDSSYIGTVLVDIEDLNKIGTVRISNGGYAYTTKVPSANVAHIVMNHTSNRETVVDHINGNGLDNRKKNLRVVSASDNNTNQNTNKRNNTGVVGIALKSRGGYLYYRATVSDRKTQMQNHPRNKSKQISKNFNINKLGKSEAFLQAKKWLQEKRKEFGYLQ